MSTIATITKAESGFEILVKDAFGRRYIYVDHIITGSLIFDREPIMAAAKGKQKAVKQRQKEDARAKKTGRDKKITAD